MVARIWFSQTRKFSLSNLMLRVEEKKWRENEEEGIEAVSDWVVLVEVIGEEKKKNQALETMLWLWQRKEKERYMVYYLSELI